MGVLDDAIREHLELKRRHGATEDDLRREEEEALGPARREVAPAEAEHAKDEAGPQEPAAPAAAVEAGREPVIHEPALPGMDEPEPVAEAEDAEAVDAEPQAEPEEPHALADEPHTQAEEPHAQAEAHADDLHETPLPEPPSEEHELPFADEPADLPDPDAELPDTQEASALRVGDTPPRGFEALEDDEPIDDDEPGEDDEAPDRDADVLKDTPDFLQETPEHDRLWFEQKPPRDFDFD